MHLSTIRVYLGECVKASINATQNYFACFDEANKREIMRKLPIVWISLFPKLKLQY
jgi:hypothetical protein